MVRSKLAKSWFNCRNNVQGERLFRNAFSIVSGATHIVCRLHIARARTPYYREVITQSR